MTDKSKERLTSMNAEVPLFGLKHLPKYLTKINISLNQVGLATLRTESVLDKEDESNVTEWFTKMQDTHTFVPTEMFIEMINTLEEEAKIRHYTLNPNSKGLSAYSRFKRLSSDLKLI